MQPQYITLPKKANNITGQTFGRLTVLGPISKNTHRQIIWLCQCACGKQATTTRGNLINSHTQSCGCKSIDVLIERSKTHGMSKSPLYKTWRHIIERCTNQNHEHYVYYGGRGIEICAEWRASFQAFYDHISQLPHCREDGFSVDRIDNNGNYQPGNVRWATMSQQRRNTRRIRNYTYNGKSQYLIEWAEEYNIKYGTLKSRLKVGWDMHDALTKPVNVFRKNK